ncbi:MAG: hypothetical protein ABSH14_09795 [Verrucomicrobiia bacterium]|jgi:hypothetical protein
MSDVEARIQAKVKKMNDDAGEAQRLENLKKAENAQRYATKKAAYDKAVIEVVKPVLNPLVAWLERNGLKARVDSTNGLYQIDFFPAGGDATGHPAVAISPDGDLENIVCVGSYGGHALRQSKKVFEPVPMPVAAITQDQLRAELFRFIEGFLPSVEQT